MNESVNPMKYDGFLSYVRLDDKAENGRIVQLSKDIADQFGLMSSSRLEIFVDKMAIGWGDDWRNRISEALNQGTFFIPIITPRYFESSACIWELQEFNSTAEALGLEALLKPILYIDFDDFNSEEPSNEYVKMIKNYNFVSWTDLRFEDRDSGTYRRAVANLAKELMNSSQLVESRQLKVLPFSNPPSITDNSSNSRNTITSDDENDSGILEEFMNLENIITSLPGYIDEIGNLLESSSNTLAEYTSEIHNQDINQLSFAARLAIMKKANAAVVPVVDKLYVKCNEYLKDFLILDSCIKKLKILYSTTEKTLIDTYNHFLNNTLTIAKKIIETGSVMEELVRTIRSVESISSELRPTLKKYRQAVQIFVDTRDLALNWT
jgi:hypothetical protein